MGGIAAGQIPRPSVPWVDNNRAEARLTRYLGCLLRLSLDPGLFSALYMARSESIASTPPTAMR